VSPTSHIPATHPVPAAGALFGPGLALAQRTAEDALTHPQVVVLFGAALFVVIIGVVFLLTSLAIRRLRAGAERFARGDLSRRLPVVGPLQLADLAESLNQMAAQLDDRLRKTLEQRNELEAVLTSMVEGVITLDLEERVTSVNRAAARMLGLHPDDVIGGALQEAVRNIALQRFVERASASVGPVEDEIQIRDRRGDRGATDSPMRLIRVHATALRDAAGERIGELIVLDDVTRLRRLETVRRDFVANVSHEIKTPVTAIKAAIETVIDTEDVHAPDARRFLEMALRQADRLHAIIEDLLMLARIEQTQENQALVTQPESVLGVLQRAAETCRASADAKRIAIEITCDAGLTAPMRAPMVEQAVINLLDNAIKYSHEDRTVRLGGVVNDGLVAIEVADEGFGIGAEHLPRLFERFYRTDRDRSRRLGGTGLGLAIVKHIAHAHRGRVEVQSELGRGSRFRVLLPCGESAVESGAAGQLSPGI